MNEIYNQILNDYKNSKVINYDSEYFYSMFVAKNEEFKKTLSKSQKIEYSEICSAYKKYLKHECLSLIEYALDDKKRKKD
jgi:hypothetical protein